MADYEETDAPSTASEDDKILAAARKHLKACIDEEAIERAKMKDDLRFAALDQWPEEIRNEREGDIENGPRPCLTIDKVSQYTTQVVNDARQGKPGINVRPQDDAADVETAKILKGLVRNIEDQSKADIAYTAAIENAVKIGLGYFRITTEYVEDGSFKDQEIFIRPIQNTFSVYMEKHMMPDGSDAERAFIMEAMPVEKFKATHPKAKAEHKDFEGVEADIVGDWKTQETITVVEEYCLERIAEMLVFLADGTTMLKADYDKWPKELADQKPEVQESRMRIKKQLKWRKMTALEVLDKRDLPGQYIPIVEVIGRETWVDGKRIVWGLVRPAKDSLRMYNYWASTLTEKMALAPKVPFIGAKGQFEGLEDRWKQANRKNFAYLEYNATDVGGVAVPRPERQGATPLEAAYMNYMQVIEHDVQTSLGMFKAAVGETESQQSGRAILALQRESDTGTYHYGANLGLSIRQAGVIIVDLIPHYYDTKRIVRILGEDGEVEAVQLDPEQPEAMREIQGRDGGIQRIFNPAVGKYDVSVMAGPGYNTKRMEAQATFVELAKGSADPMSAAVLRYQAIKNSDFSGADEAAKMLKALLPPQALEATGPGGPVPPQAQAKIMELGQQIQVMQQAGAELQQENTQLKAGAAVNMAKVEVDAKAKTDDARIESAAQAEKQRLAREQFEFDKALEIDKANHAIDLEERKAAAANKLQADKLVFDQECRAKDEEAARAEKVKDDEATAMPNFMKAFEGVLEIVGQMVESQQKFQTEIIAQMNKPKQVTLGNIRRNDGGITGASATVQ